MLGRRLIELLGSELPIIQAPMAGAQDSRLALAVCEAGGVGSLPCALLTPAQAREEITRLREQAAGPFNVNFFCHREPAPDPPRDAAWLARLTPYYEELNLEPPASLDGPGRSAFDQTMCALIEELRPPIVSFHFGLPDRSLLDRVRATGARILSSATSVEEARWLESQRVDAIIAQGAEAGGHQALFMGDGAADPVGTFTLVPQIVDAVRVPVVAAGGIADGRGIAAAFALGASGVQIGTAYLFTPEATISPLHRTALHRAGELGTALTNVFTGRPARGLLNRIVRDHGPLAADAPLFPRATPAVAPLRAAAEEQGSSDFTPLWSGQAAPLAREMPATELTRAIWNDALLATANLVAQ
jgi:nitronate monooxygenase